MKRSALQRKTPLRAVSPKRARHLRLVKDEPGRDQWKQPASGVCWCGCEMFCERLHRHHVLTEAKVRQAGGDPWSPRNQFLIAPECHEHHHNASRKIRIEVLPRTAIAFAFEVLGDGPAEDYFDRRYDTSSCPPAA